MRYDRKFDECEANDSKILTSTLTTGNLSGILRIKDNFFKFHSSSFPSFFTITKYCLRSRTEKLSSSNYVTGNRNYKFAMQYLKGDTRMYSIGLSKFASTRIGWNWPVTTLVMNISFLTLLLLASMYAHEITLEAPHHSIPLKIRN